MSELSVIQTSDIEQILIAGDLSKLSQEQRVRYAQTLCQVLGVNILSRPFDYIQLNGKLVLYANKGCAEQLRATRKVSIQITAREKIDELFVVTALAKDPEGREDGATGAVNIAGLKGEALANAMMKAETKAKRRVTLSICGLNMLDDSEVDSIPGAQRESIQLSNPVEAPQTKQNNPAAVAKDESTPLKLNRAQLGAEILKAASAINLSNKDLKEWVVDDYKKPVDKLTDQEMAHFLEVLQSEIGRKGA